MIKPWNTSPIRYRGSLNLNQNGKWRVKGNLTNYGKVGTTDAAAEGTGSLYAWNSLTSAWILKGAVTYKLSVTDSGTQPKKGMADAFGISILGYTPQGTESPLPNSGKQTLKGGDILLK